MDLAQTDSWLAGWLATCRVVSPGVPNVVPHGKASKKLDGVAAEIDLLTPSIACDLSRLALGLLGACPLARMVVKVPASA